MNKHFKRTAGVLLTVCALAGLAFAQSDAERQVTEFDVNGLKVLVKRRPGTPTVSAGLFFRGGSRNLTRVPKQLISKAATFLLGALCAELGGRMAV